MPLIVIVVRGRPVSINASSRAKTIWKSKVAMAANKVCMRPLTDMDLLTTITFFYAAFPDFDTDNVSKPIIDALIGIAYGDDKQISGCHIYRRNIKGQFTLQNPDLRVTNAIADGEDFVCITISKDDSGVVKI